MINIASYGLCYVNRTDSRSAINQRFYAAGDKNLENPIGERSFYGHVCCLYLRFNVMDNLRNSDIVGPGGFDQHHNTCIIHINIDNEDPLPVTSLITQRCIIQ